MSDLVLDSDIARRRRERAVDALEQIPGVLAATVQLGAGSRIDSARLAVAPEQPTDEIHGKAIDALRSIGYDIDHPAVLVAPIGGGGEPSASTPPRPAAPESEAIQPAPEAVLAVPEGQAPPPAWHGRFLVLDGVEVERADARVRCTVRLKRLGESFSAQVRELDTPQGRARAAARATLLAAEKAGEGVGLSLEGVVVQEFFGRRYVLAFVDGVTHRRFASLAGMMVVDQSLENAAALAILRAVERWVAW